LDWEMAVTGIAELEEEIRQLKALIPEWGTL
jgi:hypothetical protein